LLKILKKNIVYILVIGVIWLFFFPLLFLNRDSLYSWYVLKMSPSGYTPKSMRKFIMDGDKATLKGLENSIQSDRLMEQFENSDKKETLIKSFLSQMERACEFYSDAQTKDELLVEPGWLEKNSTWSSDREESANAIGSSRKVLPNVMDPDRFWKKNISYLLEALDFYKRALYYSGPEITAADKIHSIARSICKPNESILAYTSYLNHSNSYVEEILSNQEEESFKNSQSFSNKVKRFFGFGISERKEMYGLNPLMKKTIIWSYIKENHAYPVLFDYLKGMNILLLDTKLRDMSPKEADELFETMLFFLQRTDDPIQQKNERFFRFKRGIHLFKSGDFIKAKEQFSAAKEFSDLKDESTVSIRVIMSHIFQAELMIAKCEFKLKNYQEAMKSLAILENSLHSIDGRDGGKIEIDLLKDYKQTKIETLKKLGRVKESEEMEE
jgi:tetratricopeptide (TPR) repeat protein